MSQAQVEVSIVIPTLNEQICVEEVVALCWEGIRLTGRVGEVLFMDSSEDRTPEIAQALGVRVVPVLSPGIGQAYLDSIDQVRGRYVIMGDCDMTYDYREIKGFIEELDRGYDFVMGTRMKGSIQDGAMPFLHRYLGNPVTTRMFNSIYRTSFSDIHCGLRGITTDALRRLNLTSTSWEYASEMIAKASRLDLKVTEVPISYSRSKEGRRSHLRKTWYEPWRAALRNIGVMLKCARYDEE